MLKSTSVILVVLNNFKNDSRVLKEAQSLQNNGYNVKVVALHEEPLLEIENFCGVDVHRIKLKTRSWSKIKIVQTLKYFEFIYRFVKEYKEVSIIHCNDLDTLPIGFLLKIFFNKNLKIVYDAHEFEINQKPYQSKISIKFLYYMEKFLIKYTDACFTVSQSISDEYFKMYSIRPIVLYNSPKMCIVEKKDIFRNKFNIKKDSLIMIYQGGLSYGRGIESLIDVFKKRDDKVVIVFMGYGELECFIEDVSKKYNNIFLHPAVSFDVLLDYTSSASIAISYIPNSCLSYYYCMPNKLFEYAMAGLPMVASNLKDLAENITRYELGVVVREDTADSINMAIDELLLMDMKQLNLNALNFSRLHCWEKQEEKLLEAYNSL